MTTDLRATRFERIAGGFLLATVLLLVALGWMAARGDLPFTRRARFHVVVDDAQGLSPGAPVRLKGIVVGRVDEISLDEAGAVDVSFYVDGEVRDRIRAGTRVRIDAPPAIGTFLGTTALALDLSQAGGEVLDDDAVLPADPPLTLASFLGLLQDDPAGRDLRRMLSALADLTQMLAREEGGLRTLIAESAQLMARLHAADHTVGRMMTDDGKLYEEVVRLIAKMERAADQAVPLARRAGGVMEQASNALASTDRLMGRAGGTMDRTDDVMHTAKRAMTNLDRAVRDFSSATTELKKVLREMKQVVRELDVTVRAAQKVFPIRKHVGRARREAAGP